MKKIVIAASAACLLALSACGEPAFIDRPTSTETTFSTPEHRISESRAEDRVISEPTTPTTPTLTDEEISELAFLLTLGQEGVDLPKDVAIRAAETTCLFLEQGGDVDQLFLEMALNPYEQVLPEVPNEDLPFVMGAAVGAYCPEHG